jgi:DNA transformation protein
MLGGMAVSSGYLQYVLEQLAGVARVTSRRMFGGIGLYSDGLFFGLIDNDTLFFKVNDSNRGDYLARNMAALRPFPDKPDLSMSYFEVPADALEDRDELAAWARKSVAVAAAAPKPRPRVAAKSRAAAAKVKRAVRRTPARKR